MPSATMGIAKRPFEVARSKRPSSSSLQVTTEDFRKSISGAVELTLVLLLQAKQ